MAFVLLIKIMDTLVYRALHMAMMVWIVISFKNVVVALLV